MGERVTVVVVPRERFGSALRSLDRLVAKTREPHRLVVVDAGSPPGHRDALRERAGRYGFELVRSDEALCPNAARNRGLERARTEYVAFLENDVWVEAGWLEALVRCADETGADVVAPLTLIGLPRERVIHHAGGDLRREPSPEGLRLAEERRGMGRRLAELPAPLERGPSGSADFHCALVRRRVFEALGPLDEALTGTAERLDLALGVAAAGGSVWFEPKATVTYVNRAAFSLADGLYYRDRWSAARGRASWVHFARKWGLAPDSPVAAANGEFLARHASRVALPLPERARPGPAADPLRHPYAQTPAQLYRQLDRRGFVAWERQQVKRACDLAIDLFRGGTRACGKPLLCHAVGTASILADHGAPAPLVSAGLLHPAYTHGRFEPGPASETPARRASVAERVGAAAEALVHRYTVFDWGEPAGLDTGAPERIALDDAIVCLMRIANDLEERLDGALHYAGKPRGALEHWHPRWRWLAGAVGVGRLYQEYEASLGCGADVPADLVGRISPGFAARGEPHGGPALPGGSRRALRGWLRRLRRGS